VVLTAVDAARHGAVIRTRTRCVSAERSQGGWGVVVEDRHDRARGDIRARALINAAGPWVGSILAGTLRSNGPVKVRLVKGSHIVVPRLFDHDKCYIFQSADGRVVFAIPFERDFTLIGTTDHDYLGDPAAVAASAEEIDYLCSVVSMYFR